MRFTDARTFITPACFRRGITPDYVPGLKPPAHAHHVRSQLPNDSATRQIPGRQFHFHLVAHHQPQKVAFGSWRKVCGQSRHAVNLQPIQPARQLFDHHSFDPWHALRPVTSGSASVHLLLDDPDRNGSRPMSGRPRRATGARDPGRPRAASESHVPRESPQRCARSAPTDCRRASPPSTHPPAPSPPACLR